MPASGGESVAKAQLAALAPSGQRKLASAAKPALQLAAWLSTSCQAVYRLPAQRI